MSKLTVTLEELANAYRKAKVDMFYAGNCAASRLALFERNLPAHLDRLQAQLNQNTPFLNRDSTLAWTCIPKEFASRHTAHDVLYADPDDAWRASVSPQKTTHVTAVFRLMEDLPVDLHVLAALWIQKVGHLFDSKLSRSARGNRLRRTEKEKFNTLSLGSTNSYLHAYRKWRDDGLREMRRALDGGKTILTLTTDATSFYHKLDPRFMLDPAFLQTLGIRLSSEEHALNRLFIATLRQWASMTPLRRGLPVGLTASAIIANMALFGFDRWVQDELAPRSA